MTPQQRRSTVSAAGEPRPCPVCRHPTVMIRDDDGVWDYVPVEAEAAESRPSVTERTGAMRAAFGALTHAMATNRALDAAEVWRLLSAVADEAAAAASPAGPEPLPLDVERLKNAINWALGTDYNHVVVYSIAAEYLRLTRETQSKEPTTCSNCGGVGSHTEVCVHHPDVQERLSGRK